MSKSQTGIRVDGGRHATAAADSSTYLLFAGIEHPPRGGLHDLVGTFASEPEAREAFRAIRLQPPSPAAWAQLAVVDGAAMRPLCWFGIGASPDGHPINVSALARAMPDAQAGRRPRVSKRTAFVLTAMVAVATIMVGFLVDGSGSRPPINRAPVVSVTLAPTAPTGSVPPPVTSETQPERGASADGGARQPAI